MWWTRRSSSPKLQPGISTIIASFRKNCLFSALPVSAVYTDASQKKAAAGAMRYFKETAVWVALKKLSMGLGLIVLFSAVLLLSDLGRRKTDSAISPNVHAQIAATGKIVKAVPIFKDWPRRSVYLSAQPMLFAPDECVFHGGVNLQDQLA